MAVAVKTLQEPKLQLRIKLLCTCTVYMRALFSTGGCGAEVASLSGSFRVTLAR